jgi:hypothetical protein
LAPFTTGSFHDESRMSSLVGTMIFLHGVGLLFEFGDSFPCQGWQGIRQSPIGPWYNAGVRLIQANRRAAILAVTESLIRDKANENGLLD